jgi:hypothetical protein
MGDVLSVDDIARGLQGPFDFSKVGATMEAAGVIHSKWYEAGTPGAGAAPSAGLNGAALSSTSAPVTGQLPFTNAAAGNTKRLSGVEAYADQTGALIIADRLWANSSIVSTTTTAQAITPAALPSRDANGAALGAGVMAALEVSAATGNGGAITTITITYTNQAGTGSRTGTIASFPATAAVGTFVPFALQAGDTGVRSIQSITLGTTLVSGTVHLVLYRRLKTVPFGVAGAQDRAWDQVGIPRMYDGSVPWLLWVPTGTTAVNLTAGGLLYTEV